MNKNSTPVTEIRSEEEKTVLKPGHAWVEKLVCVIFAFLIWLYVVSISKINTAPPPVETTPVTEQETEMVIEPDGGDAS